MEAKHTAKIAEGLPQIRSIIEQLVEKRDQRKDGFASVIRKAMSEKLGADAEEALKVLHRQGITRSLAKRRWKAPGAQGSQSGRLLMP